ncbi:MAG: GNAT family N-acetyltransferase [Chlamydiae bacterium]|nr:GNAT family N-acetyltransferase [Chlamydiota bacterium]
MASSIQYGPCTLAENNAATVIQRNWRRKQPNILFACRIRSFELRKKEDEPHLFITVLPLERKNPLFDKTIKSLNDWMVSISKIQCKMFETCSDLHSFVYSENVSKLNSADMICCEVCRLLKMGLGSTNRLQVIFDDAKEIQAILLYNIKETEIFVNYICTAPHNLEGIDPQISGRPRIKGCCTALIEFLAFECIKRRVESIRLASTSSSCKFYEKMGFKNGGLFMTMSVKAAREFIHSKRCGMAQIVRDV